MSSSADQPALELDAVLANPRRAMAPLLASLAAAPSPQARPTLVAALRGVLDQGLDSARNLLKRPRHGLICARF